MNLAHKKVSIIVAIHDRADYLKDAIKSCLAQTHHNLEIVVIDDASPDNVKAIIDAFHDQRIKYIRHPRPIGVTDSFNNGFAHASGDFLIRLSDIDRLASHAVESMLRCFQSNPSVDFVYSDFAIYNLKNQKTDLFAVPDYFNSPSFYKISPCYLFSRRVFEKIGGYNSKYEPVEQYEFWIRAMKNFELKHCQENLCTCLIVSGRTKKTDQIRLGVLRNTLRYSRNYIYKIDLIQTIQNFFRELRRETRGRREFSLVIFQTWQIVMKLSPEAGMTYAWCVVDKLLIGSAIASLDNFRTSTLKFLHEHAATPFVKALIAFIENNKYFGAKIKILFLKHKSKNDRKTKRVLCLIPQLVVGGSEKVVGDIVEGLKPKGYTFYLLGAKRENNAWAKNFAAMFAGIVLLPEEFVNAEISSAERYYWHLCRIVKELDIELILISNPEHGYNALPRLRKEFPHIKVVDLIHLEKYSATTEKLAWVSPYIDKRVCISQRLKNVMTELAQKTDFKLKYADRLTCVYNGNDMRQFDPEKLKKGAFKKRHGIKSDKKIVSFVARMAWIKRPILFVETAKMLADKGLADSLVFVMAGDGDDTKYVKEKIQDFGLQDKFILTGMIPQNEVRELLADSYLFLLVSELEGLALVAVEAMSMSVPIISTDVGAMNEAIEHGQNGFLVDAHKNVVGDVVAIVEKLMKDPQLYDRIAKQSRVSVLSKFSMDVMVGHYERIFSDLLSQS